MWQLVKLTSNLMSLYLMVKLQLLLLVEVTKAKIITSPCCGVAPALIAESAPETPAAAMGMGKSAEQLGLFVGPIVGGILVSFSGFTSAMVLYAVITIVGSLLFLAASPEPGLLATKHEVCS
jgi:predicted MFS family arabinose efflux permease